MTALSDKLSQLKLDFMAQELDSALADAAAKNLSPADTLEWLADLELDGRRGRSVERRFRLSKLQMRHGIESFSFNHHKSRQQMKAKILHLLDLDFIAYSGEDGHSIRWKMATPGAKRRWIRIILTQVANIGQDKQHRYTNAASFPFYFRPLTRSNIEQVDGFIA